MQIKLFIGYGVKVEAEVNEWLKANREIIWNEHPEMRIDGEGLVYIMVTYTP